MEVALFQTPYRRLYKGELSLRNSSNGRGGGSGGAGDLCGLITKGADSSKNKRMRTWLHLEAKLATCEMAKQPTAMISGFSTVRRDVGRDGGP